MICIAGKNQIAINIIKYVLDKYGKENLCVLANPSDDGVGTWQPSIRRYAINNELRLVELNEVYAMDDLVLISSQYEKLLIPSKFKSPYLYNIHFSPLPKYKGHFPSVYPILNGDDTSGVTLHLIDKGIDTGDIVDQTIFPIKITDTAEDLYLNYMYYGEELIIKNLKKIVEHSVIPVPQSSIGSSFFSIKSIDYRNVIIDLKKTAFEIHNQIRAFSFRQYQIPKIFDHSVYKSEIIEEKTEGKPGEILEETFEYFLLSSIDYKVKVYKDYFTELLIACENGDVSFVKKVLPYIQDLNHKNKQGWTPLIISSYNGHQEICELLLNAGADINASNYNGTTVLMYSKSFATKTNNTSIMEFLIKHGANIEQKDNKGLTILDYASKNKETLVERFLQEL